MGLNLTQKIIKEHLISGSMETQKDIEIAIDSTLTQDSTGTMVYLQLEALDIDKIKTKCSVAYVDHNMLQTGFENADDHLYIKTVAGKYGIIFSRPGNGICHQVHLERFARPGWTLLGSDSHTPTAGGIGSLAIGAGGLDVAVAMSNGTYSMVMPKVCNIILEGKLNPPATAKDVILYILGKLTVKGGVGKIFEYSGEGVKTLSIPERATITNMGAELGATTSIFPSDEKTLEFLKLQGREDDFVELKADDDAVYDDTLTVDLSKIVPMAACPHSPDNVKPISELEGTRVTQVAIGSCTNSSYRDLTIAARILKGKKVHPDVSLVISPGSKQVLTKLSMSGALKDLIDCGARILECGCGPCIGMGQAPETNGVSLRTFNRNFEGRCGTKSAKVYLVSPEAAAISAIYGKITNPGMLGEDVFTDVEEFSYINDNMILRPEENPSKEVIKGPNIKPFPLNTPLRDSIKKKVVLKVGDNITTDHIMPSGAKLLPYRSNIPHLSNFCFSGVDPDFAKNCKENDGGFIVAGENYGQGSSREHAALVPLYLGIKVVFAKSFARIHKANLINSGIIPLVFKNPADYDKINAFDEIQIKDIAGQLKSGKTILASDKTSGRNLELILDVTEREKEILLCGGYINYMKSRRENCHA
ncbi:Aconitate hydratase [Tepidanaerobacter acetatoxydans Re1]|uniref:Aconitate hydratase n=1 Tax=Tepidanaerobacter acetatoxydans (strain DSM 21804 / JCM 16047 / Re1) TaxID=1209989 RepID=F4LSA1_TEPAE|nr:aconitate hydratase [Tepidanaerobacter acetatoxydans]AEE90364.1 aconitate hydratase [Tepidanaerobacter acetatoxydans Re1]CCP24856.1 Aconitate hydratase [Tepidanaerobacter acetatoxydans Re1]